MTNYRLTTPHEAATLIARLFTRDLVCSFDVREEKAFIAGGWLNLGKIELKAEGCSETDLASAVRRGGFEWILPKLETFYNDLCDLITWKNADAKSKAEPKLRKVLTSVAATPVRVGLQSPKFDPQALAAMPFRRSTTVVADTSGTVQGGLDFVARFLHPAARVKVPAIVHMEIINFCHRFLDNRRGARIRSADLLVDHLMSQGGQRVLLRLELHEDTEIERTFLLGDPLRSAFQQDKDPEINDLNLTVAIQSYADRLILETARQHQAQSNHGHKVQLLTSDQGLARMALAEGIMPLFFSAVVPEDLFGKRLTGATLNPFNGGLHEVALTSLVWEFATAFGTVRLTTTDKKDAIVISAIGEGLSWAPYQSHADLLWCDDSNLSARPATSDQIEQRPKSATLKQDGLTTSSVTANKTASSIAVQRFGVGTLFSVVDALAKQGQLSVDAVAQIVSVQSPRTVDEYRRFLISAELIDVEGGVWIATDRLHKLEDALLTQDTAAASSIFAQAPSFALFLKDLGSLSVGQTWKSERFGRAATTYKTLGEVCCLCASIANEGIFPTPTNPSPREFADIALRRFHQLDHGDGLVSTGGWLETLIREDGIHPEIARTLLEIASNEGLLKRSTEGSTTEVRFDEHKLNVLRISSGVPTVETVHLYRGDYLIPGKSSTSLLIESVS
ncbi:hypothetical protein FM996_00620 [Methylosinus sporium]|uniref:PIN domain-containing protein n=1 Tax=Methylosinus sporium TaxID=428 RepID=A0A549T932_METSR|nr:MULTISPECIES: PIN domain-containing protein [Methylosinus]MBU3887730.1 hypothetical protein [Methylosinus sp. KRF6]TRL38365.1 hypothetical protein FM996_00620 [Methylosinus sporium]